MTQHEEYDLICIGSGPSGQRAAVQAAKLGKRVAVLEKLRITGGVCVETGTIPSKTFREAVISFTGYGRRFIPHRGNTTGVRATARELFDGVADVVAREANIVERQLARNGVELIRGVASFEDPHTLRIETEHGTLLRKAEAIVIAVGTNPAPIPVPGLDPSVIMTSDGILQIQELPRTMTVVGGGVIGIEYASMFAAIGVEVTLVERNDRVLGFLDREIVDELVHQMRNMNVVFRFEETVQSMEVVNGSRARGVVNLDSGKRIASDVVLYAIGRQGATDTLRLQNAGLAADARGRMKVDRHFKTKIDHIYAVGDVIGFPSLAATSSEQGRLAACYMFGANACEMAEHFPIGVYSVPEISMCGQTEDELTDQKVPYEIGIARYREIARGQIIGDEDGLLKMCFHRETRDLLGVHIIGSGATELVHIGQAVMRLGGGLCYFLETVFNYPTLAECYKVAALDVANKLSCDSRLAV